MKLCKSYALFPLVLLVAACVSAAEHAPDYIDHQRPPLPIDSSGVCTHGDPSPILSKDQYRESEYSRDVIQGKPLKTVEVLKLKDGSEMRIEQVGCEDMVGIINIRVKPECPNTLDCSAELLRSLKFDSNAFFLDHWMKQIADAVNDETSNEAFKKQGQSIICLERIPGENGEYDKNQECYADIAVVKTKPGLKISFVERP